MISRSAWTTLSISGRRTFSATIRPSRRTARWTCEIDAEATGVGSIVGEDLRGRPAVLLAQDRLDLVERERPDVVAQGRELVDVRLGEQVGPGAEELAQLHERRPEVLADHAGAGAPGPGAGRRRPARPARSAGPAPRGAAPPPRPDSRNAPGSPGSAGIAAGRGDGRPSRGSRATPSRSRSQDSAPAPPIVAGTRPGHGRPPAHGPIDAGLRPLPIFVLQPIDVSVKLSLMIEMAKSDGFGKPLC